MRIFLCYMSFFGCFLALHASPIIDPSLQKELNFKTDTPITVIAKFKAQAPLRANPTLRSPAEILKHKRVIAAISQQSLISHIQLSTGALRNPPRVESLWINNSMILTASPKLIRTLFDREDLERIDLNETLHLFDPIEASPSKPFDESHATYGLKKINAMKVWNELGITGEGVVVGILDSGVDSNHEALTGRVLKTKDFVTDYEDNAPNDGHGHGTHCSGTIGGSNAGGKHIGVAPGVKFIMGKIFGDTGSTTTASILSGMQWITDPDNDPQTNDFPRVISNSWGGPMGRRYQEIINTWRAIGIIPVFAAGNSGPRPKTVGAPGGYKEVISIGATDAQDEIANFSSRGPVEFDGDLYIKPDLSAPGVNVYSAKPGGGYQNMSGTSMATPHIAGVVALMLQADPQIGAEKVREILQDTSLDLGHEGLDADYGAGRVDAFKAVNLVLTGGNVKVSTNTGNVPATIEVAPLNKTYTTDSNGQILIFLPAGTYRITARAFGHYSRTETVQIKTQQTSNLDLSLQAAPTFEISFQTVDGNGVPQNSRISFLNAPLAEGNTNGALLKLQAPGGDYMIRARTVGFETKIINLKVSSNTFSQLVLDEVPEYLVVERGSEEDSLTSFYTSALQFLGKEYTITNVVDPDTIAGYEKVIWYTGSNSNTSKIATPQEQEMLVDYVQAGGRLLMTGQDLGWSIKEGALYQFVLGAKYIADTSKVKTVTNASLTMDLDGDESANNQQWPDVIAISEKASDVQVLYSYQGQGPAILSHRYGDGHAIYMAFGFEGINGFAKRKLLITELDGILNPTITEKLTQIEKTYTRDPHTYNVMIRRFEVNDQNRLEVRKFLESVKDKAPFRRIIKEVFNEDRH